MGDNNKPFDKNCGSFSRSLLVAMIVLVIFLVGFMTAYDYVNLKTSIDHEFSALQIQTEEGIAAGLRLDDAATNLLDDRLNEQMKSSFTVLFAEYNRSGKDPAAMNLERVKAALGPGYDVYIINSSGVIAYTTYPPEEGQDFRQIPYFYAYLTKIRTSQGFFPDRVVHEALDTGVYRKYAYEPTPDHQYVMELGYISPQFNETNRRLDDKGNIEKLVSINPYIDRYRVFDTMGHDTTDNSLPDDPTEAILKQVISSRQTTETDDPANQTINRYVFVDLKNPEYGSDMSRIVELTYNTGRVQSALDRLLFVHLLFGACALGLGCLLAFILSRRMSRPIAKIARDVDVIAGGDFEHRIGTTRAREFVILEKGINTMVDSLKAATQQIKDEEIFHRDLIDQMPVGIFLKEIGTGRYIFWNHESEELFGRTAAEVIGKTDEELFSERMVTQIKKEEADAREKRLELKYSRVLTKSNGERLLHMIIVPIYDSRKSVRYILGIAEDVTDEAATLKKDLVSSITRSDILEQLAIIMTYLERAQLKTTPEDMQIFFDKTLGSVESIKNQIAYQGAIHDTGVVTPLWQPVNRAFEEAAGMLPENRVDIAGDAGNIEIFADPLLPRIFLSLLSVSFRHGGNRLSKIRLGSRMKDTSLVLVYEDDGRGIPAGEKDRLFEFGYSGENMFGLFLIRELLGFTGITIAETGDPEKGIRFEITVPAERYRPGK